MSRKEYYAQWLATNHESKAESDRAYREANSAAISARRKERYRANPEPAKERARKRFCISREAVREYAKAAYRKNADKIKAAQRANRSHIREVEKKYWGDHPEKRAVKNQRRRARLTGSYIATPDLLERAYVFIRNTPGLKCYWCGFRVAMGKRHVDHIIPLVRGGSHSPANLCCSCAPCNLSKGAKLPEEFATQGELTL